MTKLLYVGNFSQGWTTESYVLKALTGLGHEVVKVQDGASMRWQELPRRADAEGVQVVLWQKTWEPHREQALAAITALREMGVPIVSYHLDRWWGLGREGDLDRSPFFATDLMVSPDGSPVDWASRGINHLWLPPGVDEAEAKQVLRPGRGPEVVFVGSVPYPHPEWQAVRQELLDAMRARFGARFGVFPQGRVRLWGAALTALYRQAKVVLGDSCLVGSPRAYWSDRVPETMGRGGVLVHPTVEGNEGVPFDGWYVDGEHLRTYTPGHPEEAVAVVEELLADESQRERLRAAGRFQVLRRDTYRHRMETLLAHVEATFPLRAPRPVRSKPTPVTWRSRGAAVAGQFHTTGALGTDAGLTEVWTRNEYGLEQAHVRGKTVVDIGVNMGAFSVLAAKLGARRVVGFEPMPENYAMAVDNVALNRVAVELRHQAVGSSPGTFAVAGEGGGAHRAASGEAVAAEVPMVTLDAVLREVGMVGLLKVDCEGGEYAIFEGLDPELLRGVERIVMEYHGSELGHLAHLDDQVGEWGGVPAAWGRMVAKLAEYGSMTIFGRPRRVGYLTWTRLPAERLPR